LVDFDKERMLNRPRKHSRDIFLHLDNTTLYRALRDFDHLRITRFPHPPYSSDLTPCDFWLFGTLKRKLEEFTFWILIEVLTVMITILSMIHLDQFILIFDDWKCRLRKRIDRREEYL
jgi:hypothetical protein